MLIKNEDKQKIFRKKWHGRTPYEQGFEFIDLVQLKRKNTNHNEYHLYKSAEEFDVVESETIILALENVEKSELIKIVHANCRLNNFVNNADLEVIDDSDKFVYTSNVSTDDNYIEADTEFEDDDEKEDMPSAKKEEQETSEEISGEAVNEAEVQERSESSPEKDTEEKPEEVKEDS